MNSNVKKFLFLAIFTISLCHVYSSLFAQEVFFAVNDDGVSEIGIQGSESHPANLECAPPLGILGGSGAANVGDSASSGALGSDSNLYTVLSFDTVPMALGNFVMKLSEFSSIGNAFGDLGKVIVEFIASDVDFPNRLGSNSAVDGPGYTLIGRYTRDELFDIDGIDVSNAINSVLNSPDHARYIYIRIRFEMCQNGDNMEDAFRIATQGHPNRVHILGTASGVLPVDGSLAGSWFLYARNGEGAIIDIWDSAGARVVALYLFTYSDDGNGDQVYVVGAGSIVGDEVTLTMYRTHGPTFGPNFDPGDLVEVEWGTIILTFISCEEIQIDYDSPTFGMGTLNMNRLGLPIQGVTGVCSG
ncbi:MAG: hypothetical protein GY732_23060 [Gammaproteobacteria bacterium]|nr:hypothetical protein [Gammaproteobacteria bacterium]